MTTSIPLSLDLEHWHRDIETGPRPVFQAMDQANNSHEWQDREKSVRELIAWWKKVSSYDPDMEPEGLLQHADNALSKEVLGIAAAHRVRPSALSFGIMNDKDTTTLQKLITQLNIYKPAHLGYAIYLGYSWNGKIYWNGEATFSTATIVSKKGVMTNG